MSTPAPLDPRTAAAVDRVRAELAALPEAPMPPDVADRIARTLGGTGASADASPARIPRRSRVATRAAVVACAAASLIAAIVALPGAGSTDPTPAGSEDELRSAGAVTFGQEGAGALADPVRRRDCLAATGVPEPGAALLGGRPYAVDGTPGTLLVLGTAVTGRYRLVVVDAGCGPTGGRVLAEAVVGH